MVGYPKHIATRQDYENLLADPRYADRARQDLAKVAALEDATVTRVVSGSEETGDLVMEEIENPMPTWKRLGFSSREEVAPLAEVAQ